MRLLSLNVSQIKTIEHSGRRISTGIFKKPVDGPVMVRTLNVDGDAQADLRVHGGPDMAVYAYPHEHYAAWKMDLEREDLPLGQFGENLTIEGFDEQSTFVGDRLRIGGEDGPLLEVSQPRAPCQKLAIAIDEPRIGKLMLASGRTGFYLRVIEEGVLTAGDSIEVVHRDPAEFSVRDATRLKFTDREDEAALRRALKASALPDKWLERFRARLEALAPQG